MRSHPVARRGISGSVLSALLALAAGACGSSEPTEPAVATPRVTLSRARAAAGSPIDITYRFEVASDAQIAGDYRVMLHIVDADEERMWDDDHDPPVPTSQWKPGQVVEYTRTVFVPIFPYLGEATLNVGLYSATSQTRLVLQGEHVGQRAYRAARLEILPQTENLFTVFKDGWHPAEVAGDNAMVEWQWTKQVATLAFRNPKRDATFYLDFDSPGGDYVGAQQIQVSIGGQPLETITLEPRQRLLRRVPLTAAQIGATEVAEIQIAVDKTFLPAATPAAGSKDPRVLGIRVFHAFIEPG
jgi:hypothetical protein